MSDLAIWGNLPRSDWVEPWNWSDSEFGQVGSKAPLDDTQSSEILNPHFDLMDHWEHGGHPSSLFAKSIKDRNDVLDQHIRNGMPPLPTASQNGITIEANSFWRTLATFNGCPLSTLFRKLRWDVASFDIVRRSLLDRGLIFTIGYRPLRQEPLSDLYYFQDTGILHRLFNPNWTKTKKGRQNFDNSWEGFVIQVLCRGIGREAAASVWRKENDEINLLLEWRDGGRRWGIEISRSQNKRPSKGFWSSSQDLHLTDEFIIHMGECDAIKSCRRYTLERFLKEIS